MSQLFFQSVLPGTVVGCRYRWPGDCFHPDAWQRPHQGVVLALDDPRAWSETLAFPCVAPDQKAVTKHVEWCLDQGLLCDGEVPVLWTWSTGGGQKVYWDTNLRTYAEELAEWSRARLKAYADRVEKQQQEATQVA